MKKFLMLAALSLLMANKVMAEYALGAQYYKLGQLKNAFQEYQYSAVMGEVNAQFNLGVMYYRGESVPEDTITGYAWLALAAESKQEKYVRAFNDLKSQLAPDALMKGEKKLADLKKSLSDYAVLHKLMPAPDIQSQDGASFKILKQVKPTFPHSAVFTYESGLVRLGFSVAKDGSVRNIRLDLSDPTFNESAVDSLRRGHFAPTVLHNKKIDTNGIEQIYSFHGKFSLLSAKADAFLKVYEEKAKTGSAEDLYQFAFYSDVIGSLRKEDNPQADVDFYRAYSNYRQAGGRGIPMAEYRLACRYLTNDHLKNMAEALSWLERAASHGVADAQFLLGLEYFGGERVVKDEMKGLYWLNRASESGSANANVKLAWIHATAINPAYRDALKAKTYFEAVADTHLDQLSYWETKAAVAAINQDFAAAVNAQENAIKKSTEYGLTLPAQQAALIQYQSGKTWIEI